MKIHSAPTLLLLLFIQSSCSESFLDLDPYTEVPVENAIRTVTDLEASLNGCYAQLASKNLYGRSLPLIGDLASDNTYVSIRNSGKYIAFDQNLVTADNADYKGIWFDAYTAILRANNVIDAALPVQENVRQIKGEAFAIRALMYFTLVKTFARPFNQSPSSPGVPLVLHYNPTLRPARVTVEDVYSQITADLDSAARLIVVDNGSARFSQTAVAAMAAKVSLYQGDYKKAFALATEIIEQGKYRLLTRAEFLSYWASNKPHSASENRETLFEVSADASANAGADELAYMYQQQGYGDILAAKSLTASYSKTDVRGKLILPSKREAAEDPAMVINKYSSDLTGDQDDKKIIRLSEVYLIAAESACRLQREDKALFYLNHLIRERDPGLQVNATGQQLLNQIILERRKELAFEGDRLHDLNRLGAAINKTDGQFQATIPFPHPFRIGPIPETEINANPLMAQNEGY